MRMIMLNEKEIEKVSLYEYDEEKMDKILKEWYPTYDSRDYIGDDFLEDCHMDYGFKSEDVLTKELGTFNLDIMNEKDQGIMYSTLRGSFPTDIVSKYPELSDEYTEDEIYELMSEFDGWICLLVGENRYKKLVGGRGDYWLSMVD